MESLPTLAFIYLQLRVPVKAKGFSEPVHKLTPVEYDPNTFDAHADNLIANIQDLKREARAKFNRARKRERAKA